MLEDFKMQMRLTNIFLFFLLLLHVGISPVFGKEDVYKTRFFYIRHGEVPGNDPNPAIYIYTGSGTNESLTERGKIQAGECAKKISNLQKSGLIGQIAAIYSSDLKRAVETAKPIGEELGLDVELRRNLREIDWGVADGQLVQAMREQWGSMEQEVKQLYPERKVQWDYLPVFSGAETYNDLLYRTLEELKRIAEFHQGESVLIIGHGRVLKTLISEAKDSEENIPYPANGGIAEFTYSPDEGLTFIKVLNLSQ